MISNSLFYLIIGIIREKNHDPMVNTGSRFSLLRHIAKIPSSENSCFPKRNGQPTQAILF
jgi:hypothetical protein